MLGSLAVTAIVVGVSLGVVFAENRNKNTTSSTTTTTSFNSSHGTYRYAAVTCNSDVCSQIGTDIMARLGGSAVDASIATMLCVGAVESFASGIGGGHLSTIYDRPRGSSQKVMKVVIGRERAPAFATELMFFNGSASSVIGGKAIAIPGEIKGFYEAWKMFGRVEWRALFEPTIRLLKEGYYIEKRIGQYIKLYESLMRKDPNFRALFVKSDGSLVQYGDKVVNEKLATTLQRIADDPHTFYNGSLAQDIVDDIREYGGNITLDDLRGYVSAIKDPINVTLKNGNYTLYNAPPPAGGAVLDFIMSTLDGYNFSEADVSDAQRTTLAYHRIVEAFKFAYAKRSRLGDMDFVNITELIGNLTSPEYAASIRRQIDDMQTHNMAYYQPDFFVPNDHGTSHLNVLAPDGSAVAMTSTTNYYFGAQVMGSRTGIMFNDEMDDFSTPGINNVYGIPPSENNFIVPGKIPQSSMCPTVVLDSGGKVALLVGGAGGSRITTTSAFVMIGSLWFKRNAKAAEDAARIHHQLAPNLLYYESSLDKTVLAGLKSKGHNVSEVVFPSYIAVSSAIRSMCSSSASGDTKCIEAAVDGRQGGLPDGF